MEDAQNSLGDAAAVDSPKRRLGARAKLILIGLLLAAIITGAIWFISYQSHGKYLQETNDARIEADIVTVSSRVAGYVSKVMVENNQDVRSGQPLLRIDPRESRAQSEQARAQIAVAEAQRDNALATVEQQRASIVQARAQLTAARVKASYDAGEAARYRPLVAAGAESGRQLAQLEAVARQSAADAAAQAAGVAAQERRVAAIASQIRQADAQAQAGRAQLASANVDVSATLIRAATSGRIGNKTVTQGQYVQTGTRMMSIVPLARLYVTANFKETQLALMRVGQPATIKVDALDGIELRGRVASLAPGTGAQFSLLPPQNATGNFTKVTQRVPVRIALAATPASRRLLVPGLSVVVTVDTTGAKGELKQVSDAEEAAAHERLHN